MRTKGISTILVIPLLLVLVLGVIGCAKKDSAPPVISDVAVTNITSTGVTITWTTDENATSAVDYGNTNEYGKGIWVENRVSSHSVSLPGLIPNTTYHFRVRSQDNSRNEAVSADQTFTTATA